MKLMKTFAALFVLILTLLPCIEVKAAMHKENLPMEGEFDERDARSINPTEPVQAFLDNNMVYVEFYAYIPNVIIQMKDSNNNIIYTKTCSALEVEMISLAGLESGSYTLELTTERGGYMYGTFLYLC